MSKKKKKELTDEQYKELGGILLKVGGNVYTIVEEKYGVEFTDDDWEKLEKKGGVFKCENCNRWLDISEEDPGVPDFCTLCIDTMSENDEDDDE
jgi:uncharacterized protein YbaR (Trm112 family)